MRAYPAMFDLFEENVEKFKQMLNEKKSVMIELYTNDSIQFFSPLQQAEKFWLTEHPAPELKSEEKVKEE